jgi:hypothetical protein
MKEYTVTFYLDDEQQMELEHIAALFNAVYAGQVEPRNPAQMLESVVYDGLQNRLDAWRDILERKARKLEAGTP